jgi:hypothetical protein
VAPKTDRKATRRSSTGAKAAVESEAEAPKSRRSSAASAKAATPGKAVQVDPIAPLPRDFVVEWLAAPWAESRARSASAAKPSKSGNSAQDAVRAQMLKLLGPPKKPGSAGTSLRVMQGGRAG